VAVCSVAQLTDSVTSRVQRAVIEGHEGPYLILPRRRAPPPNDAAWKQTLASARSTKFSFATIPNLPGVGQHPPLAVGSQLSTKRLFAEPKKARASSRTSFWAASGKTRHVGSLSKSLSADRISATVNGSFGRPGKPLFQVAILRLAFGRVEPPAAIVDHAWPISSIRKLH
jgi:hypothetical protein